MMDTVKRVSTAFSDQHQQSEDETVAIALQKSFLISADMAHALHPNYQDKHEPQHGPAFHKGIVIKHNANQRYATNSITASAFRECAKSRGIPCQEFVVRSDMGCGSTIGPIVASRAGMRTVDVGIPQWSMHSVREMCGCDDVDYAVRHFKAFWDDMPNLDSCI
jgi:aspartyl aminopeptidase